MGRFESVPGISVANPWRSGRYESDVDRLERLIAVCSSEPGRWFAVGPTLPNALDIWVADELRRAGYGEGDVFPRASDPRVLPVSLTRALDRLPARLRSNETARLLRVLGGRSDAVVHGEFFAKSVDVVVADWDRGVELLVSTKAMTGSFGKNMTNRWEEFVGDLRNIRGRFPLAVLGVVFLADSSILVREPNAYERLTDMLRKLRREALPNRAYDATALILASSLGAGRAEMDMASVPDDLHPNQFFESALSAVFERLPASERRIARDNFQSGR